MSAPPLGITAKVRVVDCVDGDTLEVELTRRLRVRLRNAWAPELRGGDMATKYAARQSKDNLMRLALGKSGVLHVPTLDADRIGDVMTFDRVLGDVWVDGQAESLAAQQVAGGFATALKDGAHAT